MALACFLNRELKAVTLNCPIPTRQAFTPMTAIKIPWDLLPDVPPPVKYDRIETRDVLSYSAHEPQPPATSAPSWQPCPLAGTSRAA